MKTAEMAVLLALTHLATARLDGRAKLREILRHLSLEHFENLERLLVRTSFRRLLRRLLRTTLPFRHWLYLYPFVIVFRNPNSCATLRARYRHSL